MSGRFTLESDFVDSFLNAFILTNFDYYKNDSRMNDASVFQECVNLNKDVLKTANCTARKERTQSFIDSLGVKFSKFKSVATEKCSSEILSAHSISYNRSKGKDVNDPFLKNITGNAYYKKANELVSCIKSSLI